LPSAVEVNAESFSNCSEHLFASDFDSFGVLLCSAFHL